MRPSNCSSCGKTDGQQWKFTIRIKDPSRVKGTIQLRKHIMQPPPLLIKNCLAWAAAVMYKRATGLCYPVSLSALLIKNPGGQKILLFAWLFNTHSEQIIREIILCFSWNKDGGDIGQGFWCSGGKMIACNMSQVVILGQEIVGSFLANRGALAGERRWA